MVKRVCLLVMLVVLVPWISTAPDMSVRDLDSRITRLERAASKMVHLVSYVLTYVYNYHARNIQLYLLGRVQKPF